MSSPSPCPLHCSLAAKCMLEKAQVEEKAREEGVLDLDAAEALLVAYEHDSGEKADSEEQYVEVLEKLRSMKTISAEGGALLLVVPGNVGIHLNHKGTDGATSKKLTDKLMRLSTKLAVPLGEAWARNSTQYKTQLEKVQRRAIVHYRQQVESQVFKRKQILQTMPRAESGKNGSKQRKSLAAANV